MRKLKRQELQHIFNTAYRDKEKAEIVSRTESGLLDVDQGEVLRNPRYQRTFKI